MSEVTLGVRLIQKVDMTKWLVVTSILFVGLTAFTCYIELSGAIQNKNFVDSQQKAMEHVSLAVNVTRGTDNLRLNVAKQLYGNDSEKNIYSSAAVAELERAIADLVKRGKEMQISSYISKDIDALGERWNAFKSRFSEAPNAEQQENAEELNTMAGRIIESLNLDTELGQEPDMQIGQKIAVALRYCTDVIDKNIHLAENSFVVAAGKTDPESIAHFQNSINIAAYVMSEFQARINKIDNIGSNYNASDYDPAKLVLAPAQATDPEAIVKHAKMVVVVSQENLKKLYALTDGLRASVSNYFESVQKVQAQRLVFKSVASILVTAILMLFFFYFAKSSKMSVLKMVEYVNEVAEGDISQEIVVERKDEFGRMMLALNAMKIKIREILQNIQNSSQTVGRSVEEISQGNLDLSRRTEQQANSLATTAASMEELAVTVKENATQSQKAAELAKEAKQHAEHGGHVVKDAIASMTQINASSKKIEEIIGVIDDIAFQTNLLALNAAVEAARAGEQGRGFAVVAAEVRNLAQRSSSAAKEIHDLIKESVEKIENGTDLVTKSGVALGEIVGSVGQVSELVNSMAEATTQQSIGLQEITQAIAKIDGITQQNAALVEETAAASENTNQQMHELIGFTGFFKINKTQGSSAVTASVSPSPKLTEASSVVSKAAIKTYVPKTGEFSASAPKDDWKEF